MLAKVDVLGSFDFYTSLISLDALSAEDIQGMQVALGDGDFKKLVDGGRLTPDQYQLAAKILPLAAHEYTHFLDATSTLWGFKHLSLMNEAYLSDNKYGTDESGFSKAKTFYDHSRRIRLPNYYTVVNSKTQNIRPWQSHISIGALFSNEGLITNRPVLFSRFSNSRGEQLARSPVSTVSLLEASAMAQELLLHWLLIQHTEDDFRTVEQKHFETRTLDYLHNPEITEYSVCAHIVANQQQCTNVLATFYLCSVIVRLILNLPESSIQKIADNCSVSEVLKLPKDAPTVMAVQNGLKIGDLGVLYYMVCAALPEQSYVSHKAAISGTIAALETIGVDYATLRSDRNKFAYDLCVELWASKIQSISTLSKAAYDNFQKIGDNDFALNFNGLNLPPALLSDSSASLIFSCDSNLLTNFNLDDCFNELFEGQSWVERFSEACI